MRIVSDNEIRLAVLSARTQGGGLLRKRADLAFLAKQKFPGWEVIKCERYEKTAHAVFDVILAASLRHPVEVRMVGNGFHYWIMQRHLTVGDWFRKIYLSTPKLLMP